MTQTTSAFCPPIEIDEELLLWLHIQSLSGIGSRRFIQLFNHFGSIDRILSASALELQNLKLPQSLALLLKQDIPWNQLKANLVRSLEQGIFPLRMCDPLYPKELLLSPYCEPLIWVQGQWPPPSARQLGVVGTRRPTQTGLEYAFKTGQFLAEHQISCISGMAWGIDRAAHRGCLENQGYTIAVLGQGLLSPYPEEGRRVLEEIKKNGCLISQFPPDLKAQPGTFPARNRLISGMSQGVILVESALKGGAMITAQLCIDEGKELMVFPGVLENPVALGPLTLANQGASLLTSYSDILNITQSNYRNSRAHQRVIHQAPQGNSQKKATAHVATQTSFVSPTNQAFITPQTPAPPPHLVPILSKLHTLHSPIHQEELVQHLRHTQAFCGDLINPMSILSELELLGLISSKNGYISLHL